MGDLAPAPPLAAVADAAEECAGGKTPVIKWNEYARQHIKACRKMLNPKLIPCQIPDLFKLAGAMEKHFWHVLTMHYPLITQSVILSNCCTLQRLLRGSPCQMWAQCTIVGHPSLEVGGGGPQHANAMWALCTHIDNEYTKVVASGTKPAGFMQHPEGRQGAQSGTHSVHASMTPVGSAGLAAAAFHWQPFFLAVVSSHANGKVYEITGDDFVDCCTAFAGNVCVGMRAATKQGKAVVKPCVGDDVERVDDSDDVEVEVTDGEKLMVLTKAGPYHTMNAGWSPLGWALQYGHATQSKTGITRGALHFLMQGQSDKAKANFKRMGITDAITFNAMHRELERIAPPRSIR